MTVLRLWKTSGSGSASPELSLKRVSGHRQRAMTRKTGQRRGGAVKRGGGAFPGQFSKRRIPYRKSAKNNLWSGDASKTRFRVPPTRNDAKDRSSTGAVQQNAVVGHFRRIFSVIRYSLLMTYYQTLQLGMKFRFIPLTWILRNFLKTKRQTLD